VALNCAPSPARPPGDCLALLHPDLLARQEEYARAFREADPFPHVVFENFLAPAVCEEVLASFPPFERGCALNETGLPGGKSVNVDVRALGGVFERLDDLARSAEFLHLVSRVSGIPDLLYDPEYVGGGTHENRTTQELNPHVDFNYHPGRGWHRRLNLILYLNPVWEEAWGGSLELHKDPWKPDEDRVRSVLPLKNCCVMFETSERSWHGFRRITPPPGTSYLSRRSFAIYLYTKDRPKEETAPPHATVYVERPLPEFVRPGALLSEEQTGEITRLVERRRQLMDYLFRREHRALGTLNALTAGLLSKARGPLTREVVEGVRDLFKVADGDLKHLYEREKLYSGLLQAVEELQRGHPVLLPLEGPVEQVGAAGGYWEDQWASPAVNFHCRAAAPIRALRLEGWVPDGLGGGQVLEVRVGEQTSTLRLGTGPFAADVPAGLAGGEQAPVRIVARHCWNPNRDGASGDSRDLAFRVMRILAA
jgi:hypothetical protein